MDQTIQEKDYGINTLAEMFKRGLDIQTGPVDRPSKPFSQVPWVYICVNKILDTASGISCILSTAGDDVLESGPAYDFLFNNPNMPLDEFLQQTIGYVSLFKECYWVYLGKDGTAPTDILVVGPDQLKPVIRSGVLVGYELRLPGGNRIKLFVEDVYPLLGFNPDQGYRGIGPLLAGAVSVSSSYQAALYNEASLSNGARISTVLTVPQGANLSREEKEFLKAEFKATHGGSRNAGKTFLATGGMDVKTLSQTMAELQMIDLRRFDAAEICALFGVPPEIVGLNSEAQYAHGPATQRFITDTISPLLSFVGRHITAGILRKYRFKAAGKAVPFAQSKTLATSRMKLNMRPTYRLARTKAFQSGQDLFAWFSIEDHPAIQEMLRDRAEKMMKYNEKGVPLNQIIDAGDLPFEHVEWGDDWWVNMGMVPARLIMEGGMEAVTGPALPEPADDDEPEKSTEAPSASDRIADKQKAALIWKKWAASWQPLEKQFKEQLRQYFRRQKSDYLKRLQAAMDESKSLRTKEVEELITRIQFDLTEENKKIRVLHKIFFDRAVMLGAAQTVTEVTGQTGAALKETAQQIARRQAIKRTLTISARKIENINTTTQNLIASQMREGLGKGEGLQEIAKRIQSSTAFSPSRALTIARTNTGSGVSAGRHEAAKHVGAELKSWITSRDENVRKTHSRCEQETKDGIGIDQPFILGGNAYLMHPGDPNGPAGEVVNCRCLEVVRRAAGKSFSLDHYAQVRMLDYMECKTLLEAD